MHPINRSMVLRLSIVWMLAVLSGLAHDARGDIHIAEELLVDLRSEDLAPGPVTEWINHGSLGGSFFAVGTPNVEDVADWENAVSLDGNSYFEGPRSVPGIEGNDERSVEIWAYKIGLAGEETMVSWAHRGGPDGSNFGFNYSTNASWGAVGHWGAGPDMGWGGNHSPTPAVETWWHLVYTYDGATARLYVNGEPAGEENVTLNTHANGIIRVGSQGDNTGEQANTNMNFAGAIAQVRIHDGVLTPEQIRENSLIRIRAFENASTPSPDDAVTDVFRDAALSWSPGVSVATHNVYFGTVPDDVEAASVDDPRGVLVGDGQTETTLDPGRLTFGQTYYWRVDEVNGAPDFAIFKGDIWSFTAEPLSIPITSVAATASSSFGASGPERTVDGSGLVDDLHGTTASDMWISGAIPATIEYAFDRAYRLHELWIWNSNQLIEAFVGFGAKDVVIEHSLDGENWTVLEGVGPLARATGLEGYAHNNTIDFAGAVAQHVRVTVNSVQGIAPQASLSEVRFYHIPTFATRPNPDSGATDVAPDSSLSWGRNGREADRHEVYVGTDPNNLSSAGTVTESSLDTLALDLQLGQTYHWRVDENNDVMDPSTWVGDVWSFTTAGTIPVDDMESYKDAEFFEIWATWIDGFDDPANGSLAGGASGTPETDIVQDGSQSLPLTFDNSTAAVSEATRTFDAAMDWTKNGVQALVLYFQGSSDNTGGALYVKINDAKVAYDGDAADLMSFGWSKWYIPLSEVTGTDLSLVNSLTIGVDNGGTGVVYIDSIVLTGAARDLVSPVDPGTAGLLAHYPLDGDYQDASGNGLNGSAVGNPVFENDPARGQVLSLNGIDAAVDLGASDIFNFPGSFSLSVWANITEFNSNWGHALLGKRGESGVGWQLRRHSGNPNLTFTTRGTDGPDDPRGNIDITTAFGQWVHVAAVYDMEAGQRTVYVNGSVDVSIDDGGTVANATQNTYIGARSNSANTGPEAFFSGSLDEVRVYGRALSLEEVASLAGRTQPFDRP